MHYPLADVRVLCDSQFTDEPKADPPVRNGLELHVFAVSSEVTHLVVVISKPDVAAPGYRNIHAPRIMFHCSHAQRQAVECSRCDTRYVKHTAIRIEPSEHELWIP